MDEETRAKKAVEAAVEAAMEVTDRFMATFNAKDAAGHAATLGYPHVRMASNGVRSWETEAEATAVMEEAFERLTELVGWDHSDWNERRVVHAWPDKVHLAVGFSRRKADGTEIGSYEAIYVILDTVDGWRIQARSSSAP